MEMRVSGKIELVVGYIDKGVGGVNGANALVDQFATDNKGFVLVNQSLQTGAAVANVLSIVKLTTGLVPFLNIATNMTAGTVTFLKIIAEQKESDGDKKGFNKGDVISLVGNVAGVVAGFTLLAGVVGATTFFTTIAVGAAVAGLVTSAAAKKLHDSVLLPLWEQHFRDTPDATYPDHWVSPDMRLVPRMMIDTDYAGMIAQIRLDPATDDISIGSTAVDAGDADVSNGGGGGGASGTSEGTGPATTVAAPSSGTEAEEATNPVENGDTPADGTGIANGDGGSGPGGDLLGAPGTTPDGDGSPAPGAELEISIESVNGDPSQGHPPIPPEPETSHPPHPAPPVEVQDSYGCCTNTQDTYG
jgi:hypothetical protein